MLIDKILYGTIPDGLHAGWISYIIQVTGDVADEGELADVILKIRDHPGPSKYITLYGVYNDDNSTYMITLLKALIDMGYIIRAMSDGQMYYSWFTMVKHLIVKISSEKWPMFNCAELHYLMVSADDPEPYLPEQSEKIPKYIEAADSIPRAALMGFINKSKTTWAVLLGAKRIIAEELK